METPIEDIARDNVESAATAPNAETLETPTTAMDTTNPSSAGAMQAETGNAGASEKVFVANAPEEIVVEQPAQVESQLSEQAPEPTIVEATQVDTAPLTTTTTEGWDAAQDQLMKDAAATPMTPAAPDSASKRSVRSSQRTSFAAATPPSKANGGTPASTGRGRGPGRPRGSRSRGSGAGRGRGGKRKRDEDADDDDSDSSEVYTPAATQTKSGRAVQKPTSFVPPPAASPAAPVGIKRKRAYRRNPEAAVCKSCLRGTSPASNMIVFCDGCNTPYHRYCHHPPIDQSVIDEVEMEWFCRTCERDRVVPVADVEVEGFVSAVGATADERRQHFSRLPPGVLATLLVRATTLQPDLPVFDPGFAEKIATKVPNGTTETTPSIVTPAAQPKQATVTPAFAGKPRVDEQDEMNDIPNEHPEHYPRPGQGLMQTLPPDYKETERLVDEVDKHRVFSHVYQVDAAVANGEKDAGVGASRDDEK